MFKPRTLEEVIHRAARTFPAVVVTGPRQSGKTTLLKKNFGNTHKFVSLEDPDTRMRAKEDPVGFLAYHKPPVIFDEIQYVPELLSYIKTDIDNDRAPGQWLFTGSQAFVLMQGASESLAGRAAILTLLPFSYAEHIGNGGGSLDTAQWLTALGTVRTVRTDDKRPSLINYILRGSYPEIAENKNVDRQLWCSSYISTYLERDIRAIANVGDLSTFERFLRLCATRTGTILNMADFARDVGVSVPTVKRWMSVLETGHQVLLLYPYYKNIGKRLIKSPKLYFNDTALASYLLGIHDPETLRASPHFGALFETMVITDMLKRFVHHGAMSSLYYMRTRDGLEVDAVIESAEKLHLFEIKSTETLLPKHASSLVQMSAEYDGIVDTSMIIYAGKNNRHIQKQVSGIGWHKALCI